MPRGALLSPLAVAGRVPTASPCTLLVDSAGLKPCGKGEWLFEKHGTATRRLWRALHVGVDAGTGRIVADGDGVSAPASPIPAPR